MYQNSRKYSERRRDENDDDLPIAIGARTSLTINPIGTLEVKLWNGKNVKISRVFNEARFYVKFSLGSHSSARSQESPLTNEPFWYEIIVLTVYNMRETKVNFEVFGGNSSFILIGGGGFDFAAALSHPMVWTDPFWCNVNRKGSMNGCILLSACFTPYRRQDITVVDYSAPSPQRNDLPPPAYELEENSARSSTSNLPTTSFSANLAISSSFQSSHNTRASVTNSASRNRNQREVTNNGSSSRNLEPVLLLDTSGSMNWPVSSQLPLRGLTRRNLVESAISTIVARLGEYDAQAQYSNGTGGLKTIVFSSEMVMGLGNMNSVNFKEKWNSVRWNGASAILPGWSMVLQEYLLEFGDLEVERRPMLVCMCLTDGVASDWPAFQEALATEAGTQGIEYRLAVFLVGDDSESINALLRMQHVAAMNGRVEVYSLQRAISGEEVSNVVLEMVKKHI